MNPKAFASSGAAADRNVRAPLPIAGYAGRGCAVRGSSAPGIGALNPFRIGNTCNLMGRGSSLLLFVFSLVLFLSGCKGIPTTRERQARADAHSIADQYQPGGQRPHLPDLSTNSGLQDYLRFAILNQPRA